MSHYEKAWQAVKARIALAARAAGRSPDEVTLTAVSKTFAPEAVRAVHALGQRVFAENYVQEGVAKRRALADLADIEWRLIGPLQANKTAIVAQEFNGVESVDRLRIAERLSAQRGADRPPLEVLIQVNISSEVTKSGVAPGDALALARQVAGLPRLRLAGYMGIAAPGADPDEQRRQFRQLRDCLSLARSEGLALDTLSMGMSADLEAAVAEGSTEVRVGSAIFGGRGAPP
jgi:pyridoxal phosphate enzyme (YggS family)